MGSIRRIGSIVSRHGIYALLSVPVMLFIISLFIKPVVVFDTAYGFIAFRSMLEGASFNNVTTPDPLNIANDIGKFLAWWTPGQYLVPGIFVWLGTDYGLAVTLTALITNIIGVLGWAHIARSFEVSRFVLFLFMLGLVTFHYATNPFFRFYNGGEVILFAALPWSLSALLWAIKQSPAVSFAVSMLMAALLFFAKLSGLIAFAANVAAIGLLELTRRRQLTASLLAMGAGSAVAAGVILVTWLGHSHSPVAVAAYAFTWPVLLYPIAAVAFAGFSLHDLLGWLLLHPSAPVLSDIGKTSYVLGPLGLLLMAWVWIRLRKTRYRGMAICLLTIIAAYVAASVAMYVRSAAIIPFEERYFRYVGILSYLLLLVAIDQWRSSFPRVILTLIVGTFSVYGLTSYANGVREIMRAHSYDQVSGTSMLNVSPVVLEYLRSERALHNWQRPIAVIPAPEAANGLPGFRVILEFLFVDGNSLEHTANQRWAGRAEKVFVILEGKLHNSAKAEALLRTFVDYDIEKWRQIQMDGMVVYSQ